MSRRSLLAVAWLMTLAAGIVIISDHALALDQSRADDSSALGLFAFFYGLLHGENLIILLKGLAPEGKLILTGIGAGIVSVAALFRRR